VYQIDALIYSSHAPDFLTKLPELVPNYWNCVKRLCCCNQKFGIWAASRNSWNVQRYFCESIGKT